MESSEQLVERISRYLAGPEQLLTDETRLLAGQYADASFELNRRFERIDGLLSRGQTGEAVEQALVHPPVVDAYRTLAFGERAAWLDICDLYGLAGAPELPQTALERLLAAYQDQRAIAPLLNRYREKVQKGTTAERLAAARDLRGAEPRNPDWRDEVARWESKRCPELLVEARRAIESDDDSLLERLQDELRRDDWTVKPDERMVAKVAAEVARRQAVRDRRRADRLLARLGEAYSALQVEQVMSRLAQWEAFLSESGFAPDESDSLQVAEAQAWAKEEQARIDEEKNDQKMLSEFAAALEKRKFREAEKLLFKIEQRSLELSAGLVSRYEGLREEHSCVERRNYRLRLVKLGSACAVLLVVVGFAIQYYVKVREFDAALAGLSAHVDASEIEAARRTVDALAVAHPKFLAESRMAAQVARLEELENAEKWRQEQLDNLLKTLTAWQESGFPSAGADVDGLLAEAGKLVRSSSEENKVTQIDLKWQMHQNASQQERDTEYMARVRAHDETLRELESRDMTADLAGFERDLGAFSGRFSAFGAAAAGVSEELRRSQEEMLKNRCDALRSRHEQAVAREREIVAGLNRLWISAANLDNYLRVLSRQADNFPTEPQFMDLMPLLRDAAFYREAPLLAQVELGKASLGELRNIRANWGGEETPQVWGAEMRNFADARIKLLENMDKVRDGLKELGGSPLLARPCWFLVFEKPNRERLSFVFFKQPILDDKRLWADSALSTQPGDVENLRFYFGSSGWYTTVIEDGREIVRERNLKCVVGRPTGAATARHTSFASKLLADLERCSNDDLPDFLGRKLEEVRAEPRFSARLRLQVMQRFYQLAAQLLYAQATEECTRQDTEITKLLADVAETDWVRAERIESKRRAIAEPVEKLPGISAMLLRTASREAVETLAFGRQLAYAGIVRSAPGGFRADLFREGRSGELWIVAPPTSRAEGSFIVVGDSARAGDVFDDAAVQLLANGMPLFMPLDGRSTTELSKRVKEMFKDEPGALGWPHAWPQNRR